MDFGCGIGSAVPDFFDILGIVSLLGVDTSLKSVEVARHKFAGRATFEAIGRFQPKEQFDIAFCNGAFHHIPLRSRATAVAFVHRALRPGGLFAFWENNPWNPGTRYIMSRIPCDRDAVTLTTQEARQILQAGGFEILRTDFLFVFPRVLKHFRWIEPKICKFPLGAQYQILCRKL